MQIRCVQPACELLQVGLRTTTSTVHTGVSEYRASGSYPRSLQLLTHTPRSSAMLCIAPKRWPSRAAERQAHAATICQHTCGMLQVIRCGEHVQVSRGLGAGSSSKECLQEVIPRCMAATWRLGDEVHPTSHRPHRFAAKICADLLGARDACTCCARTLYALCIGPGWVLEGGIKAARVRVPI